MFYPSWCCKAVTTDTLLLLYQSYQSHPSKHRWDSVKFVFINLNLSPVVFFKLWVDETKLEDNVNLKVQKPKFESVISYSYSQGSRWSHQERRNMELNQINQTQIRGKTDQIEPNQAVKTQLDLHSTANPRGKNVNNANNSNWSKKATKPIQTKPKPTKSKPKEKKTRSTILANPVKPWKIIQKSSAKISTL